MPAVDRHPDIAYEHHLRMGETIVRSVWRADGRHLTDRVLAHVLVRASVSGRHGLRPADECVRHMFYSNRLNSALSNAAVRLHQPRRADVLHEGRRLVGTEL